MLIVILLISWFESGFPCARVLYRRNSLKKWISLIERSPSETESCLVIGTGALH